MDEQKTAIQKPAAAVADYSNEINAMYDAQRQQQTQNLENAYNQNLSTLQQSKEQIAPTYFNQGNDLATQYERTRRNSNMRADMNGLNTGTASQMDLAQQSNYLSSYGQIRAAQANAERQADRQIADLEMNYKNSVAQALADNDYQRAAAMLSEYKRRDEAAKEEQRYQYQIQTAEQKYQDQLARQQEQDAFAREQYNNSLARQQEQDAFTREQYNNSLTRQQEQDAFARQQYNNSLTRQQAQDEFARQQYADQLARQQQQDAFSREQYNYQVEQARNQQALNEAKQRAAYGDFSGYEALYGADTANAMQQFWAMNNPDYAYSMGLITADQYEQMTGYSPDRSSLYSGYSSGGSSGTIEGSGVYGSDGGDDATPEITDTDWAEFARQLGQYDSTSKIDSALRNIDNAATNTADRNGLRPGTQAYEDFVNEYKRINTPDALVDAQTHYSEIKARENVAAQQAARAKNQADLKQLVADTKTAVTSPKSSGSAYSAEASKAAFDNSPIGKLWNSITGKSSATTTSSKSKPTPISR